MKDLNKELEKLHDGEYNIKINDDYEIINANSDEIFYTYELIAISQDKNCNYSMLAKRKNYEYIDIIRIFNKDDLATMLVDILSKSKKEEVGNYSKIEINAEDAEQFEIEVRSSGKEKFYLDVSGSFVLLTECKNPEINKVLLNKEYIDRVTYKINKKSFKIDTNFTEAKIKMYRDCYKVKSIDIKKENGKVSRYELNHIIGEVYINHLSGSAVNFGLREDFEKDIL